jgi:hypothetical protein
MELALLVGGSALLIALQAVQQSQQIGVARPK